MIKALYPIGKTQWAKWSDEQQVAFNEAREAGVPYMEAIASTNAARKKKKNVVNIIEDAGEIAVRLADVASDVMPAVAIAKALIRSTKKKKVT